MVGISIPSKKNLFSFGAPPRITKSLRNEGIESKDLILIHSNMNELTRCGLSPPVIVDKLINELNSKKIQNNIYTFGSALDTNLSSDEKKFSQGSTNLGLVLDHIKSNKNNI